MSINNKRSFKMARDYPCYKLGATLRSGVLAYMRKYNIDYETVSIVNSYDGQSYKPKYVPITMDILLQLKEIVPNKVKVIDRAISVLQGKGDTKPITYIEYTTWDKMCGFTLNTFNVMRTTQKTKYRLIRYLGNGNLLNGWNKYKRNIERMEDRVLEFGLNYKTLTAYSKDIHRYYGGKNFYSPMYILRRIERDTLANKYTMGSYRRLCRLMKAINKLEKEKQWYKMKN